MRSTSRFFFVIFVLAGACFAASGAVFVLSNGDRLSGEIVEQDADSVTIKMAVGGATVKLPRSALKAPTEGEPAPQAISLKTPATPTKTPPPPSTVPVAQAEETAPTETDQHQFIGLPNRAYESWISFWEDNLLFRALARIYPLMDWKNKVDLGFFNQRAEKDEQSLTIGLLTEKRKEKHQTRLQLTYEYAKSTLIRTTIDPLTGDPKRERITTKTRDRIRGNARYRYDYVKSFFAQTDTRYQRALVSNIFHEVDELLGIGYRWIDTDRLEGTITPSVGFGYRDIVPDEPSWEWLASLQQDLTLTLTERVKISEESILTYAPSETGDITVNFKAGLENKLNQRLSLNLSYDFTYDERKEPDKGRTRNSIKLTLGAAF